MAIETGIADEINILKGGTTEQADLLGVRTSGTHRKSDNVERVPDIGSAKYSGIMDGVAEVSASVSGYPANLKCLQYMGSFTDNGDGTYTVVPTDSLNEYTIKQQKVGGGGVVTITGFKFGSFSVSASRTGTALEAEFDGLGKTFEYDSSGDISTPSPAGQLRSPYQTYVKLAGSTVGSVESWSVDFGRNLESFKGLEDSSNWRQPSAIIEKLYDISWNVVINIEDDTAYKRAMNQSSSPYSINDDRGNITVEFVINTAAGTDTFSLTGSRPTEISAEMANDLEVRTAALAGVSLDWSLTGDLS